MNNILHCNRNPMQRTALVSRDLIELPGLLQDGVWVEVDPCFDGGVARRDSGEEGTGVRFDGEVV